MSASPKPNAETEIPMVKRNTKWATIATIASVAMIACCRLVGCLSGLLIF
jgi:hypothetical protein